MFFEPRPPLTREAEKQGVNCQHWLPYTHYAHGIPMGSHQPRHGPPTPYVICADARTLQDIVSATCAREDLLILAVSPAYPSTDPDGKTWHTITVLYQELLTPQGTSVADEEGDES